MYCMLSLLFVAKMIADDYYTLFIVGSLQSNINPEYLSQCDKSCVTIKFVHTGSHIYIGISFYIYCELCKSFLFCFVLICLWCVKFKRTCNLLNEFVFFVVSLFEIYIAVVTSRQFYHPIDKAFVQQYTKSYWIFFFQILCSFSRSIFEHVQIP